MVNMREGMDNMPKESGLGDREARDRMKRDIERERAAQYGDSDMEPSPEDPMALFNLLRGLDEDMGNLQDQIALLEKRIGRILTVPQSNESTVEFNAYKEPTPEGLSDASLKVLGMINTLRGARYHIKDVISRVSL